MRDWKSSSPLANSDAGIDRLGRVDHSSQSGTKGPPRFGQIPERRHPKGPGAVELKRAIMLPIGEVIRPRAGRS
jgi:hypothetical protein